MKQVGIKIYRELQRVNITANNWDMHRVILRGLLVALVGLALSYSLLLSVMVKNIVERKNLERKILTLSTEVGDLELSYLAISEEVDLELSRTMGFKEAIANFATRKSSLGALTGSGNEI